MKRHTIPFSYNPIKVTFIYEKDLSFHPMDDMHISETMSDGTHISKSKAYTYGSNGLLSSRILPGGKDYSYTYDAYGNLIGLDFDSGTIEWNLTAYNGKRTISRTVIQGSSSHPFIKEIILDSNGLLDSITTCQDNCYYQADDYGFSAQTGNLTYRKNNSSYYPQTYSYDNADRLIAVYQNNQTIQSMTYSYTDNITYKTGIGTYDYNTTRPHAVVAVDNTAGIIHTDEQYITYNPWGKVSAVLHSDGTDSYNYSIGYGPDQQRITSSMSKNNSLQYETFYWDDYEEKKVGNDLYQYYYVYGANGLEGLHVVKTTPNNQTTTHTTKVVTDHLGSIMSLIDNSDWVYDASFDTWGKRDLSMPYWFDSGFDRGFTGHEHLDEMGLINMNGRMYDPDLGRFLSPDPFIQSPYNPQNYNRYSYCLNNPLKYTDPEGEFVWAPVIIGAIIGAYSGGVMANDGNWNLCSWNWKSDKTWGYIAGGAALGALSSGVCQGMTSIGADHFISQLVSNTLTSTLSSGLTSEWDGERLLMGFATGYMSGMYAGALSVLYDPVGMINGMLADGSLGILSGAVNGGLTSVCFDGDFCEGALNGAIMGGITGMACGAFRGWTNAMTLGVNNLTGGSLQERAQAWAYYYGFKDVDVLVLDNKGIEKYNSYRGDYTLKKDYLDSNIYAYSDKPTQRIDGISRFHDRQMYLTKATVRHSSFAPGWGQGTFWHEYTHIVRQSGDEFFPYKIGLEKGGVGYYRHCKSYTDFQKYSFSRP